jgi:hypothetical protein
MLGTAPGGADRGAHDQRYRHRAARHVAQHRGVAVDLVHGAEQEIAVLHVDNRAHAHDRRADGGTEEAVLRNRRVQDTVGKAFLEPERDREGTAPAAGHANVLAKTEHAPVALHLLGNPVTQRFGNGQMFHGDLW